MADSKRALSGGTHRSGLKIWTCGLLCAVVALALLGAAFWAAWNIYGLSLATGGKQLGFSLWTDGGPLVELSRKLNSRFPDFMKGLAKPSRPVSLGLSIIAASGLLLAFLSRKNIGVLPRSIVSPTLPWRFSPRIRLLAFIVGITCMAVLLARVTSDQSRVQDMFLWVASIVFIGAVFFDRSDGRPAPLLSRGEWIGLGIVTVLSAAFYMWHATWWLYSSIGDEYRFYESALGIISGKQILKPFSPAGVYGHHPRMGSLYQAVVMKFLGENNFGWRASSAIAAALCFIPFYYFMKYYFSKTAAVIGTGVLACSSYLATFARLGYNNNHGNVFICVAFGLYAYFRRSPSRRRGYLCGSFLGLGFFFFHPGKVSLLVVLTLYLADLVRERSMRRWEYPVSFLMGMLVVAAPIICHPHWYAVASPAGFTFMRAVEIGFIEPWGGSMAAGIALFIGNNMLLALLSPLYFPRSSHFIYRSYLDPVSAALFTLGLFWALVWAFRRRQEAALLISFVGAMIFVGGIAKYPFPVPTRSLILFPWWAAFSGIGAWRLLELGCFFSARRRLWWSVCWVLVVLISALNMYQLYEVVPSNYGLNYKMLVLKEAQAAPPEYHMYYLTDGDRGMASKLRIYGFGSRFHQILNKEFLDGDLWTMLITPALIFVDNRNSEMDRILEELRSRLPGSVERMVSGPRDRVSMQVFHVNEGSNPPSTVPLRFVGSFDLRSIARRKIYGVADLAGFPDGTMVVVSRKGDYGAVISEDGDKVELWRCKEYDGIAWKDVRLIPEKPGRMWVVCVRGGVPVVGLFHTNGRKIWCKSLSPHHLGGGAPAEDGGLFVVSHKGDLMWHVSPEGEIKDSQLVGMPKRKLNIRAMTAPPDSRFYLADVISEKILVLSRDLLFEGEIASPVPFGREVRLMADDNGFLYLGTGNTLSALDMEDLESGRGWTVELDELSIWGLASLGRGRIAIGDFSTYGGYPIIWLAEVDAGGGIFERYENK